MSEVEEMVLPVEETILPFDYTRFKGIRPIPLKHFIQMSESKEITDDKLHCISLYVLEQMSDNEYQMSLHDFFVNLYELMTIHYVDNGSFFYYYQSYGIQHTMKDGILHYYSLYPNDFIMEFSKHVKLIQTKHSHLWKLFDDELKAKAFKIFYTINTIKNDMCFIGYLCDVRRISEFMLHLGSDELITIINKMNEESFSLTSYECDKIMYECIYSIMRRSKSYDLMRLYPILKSEVELIALLKSLMSELSSPFSFKKLTDYIDSNQDSQQPISQDDKDICILYNIIICFEKMIQIDWKNLVTMNGISNIVFLHNILRHFPSGSENRKKLTDKYLEIVDLSINHSDKNSEQNTMKRHKLDRSIRWIIS